MTPRAFIQRDEDAAHGTMTVLRALYVSNDMAEDVFSMT